MSITQAKKIAKKYAGVLKKNKFPFSNIYLYGSYAKRKAKKHSDIDIAVITDKIENNKKYWNKKIRLWEFVLEVDSRIEPVLLEKDDLKKDSTILGSQVKKHGIQIVP